MPREKKETLTIRVSERQKELLKSTAEARGVSASRLISDFIDSLDLSDKSLISRMRDIQEQLNEMAKRLNEKG